MKQVLQNLLVLALLVSSMNVFAQKNDSKSNHIHVEDYNFKDDRDVMSKIKVSFLTLFQNIEVENSEYAKFYQFLEVDAKSFFYDLNKLLLYKTDTNTSQIDDLFITNLDLFKNKYRNFKLELPPNDDYLSLEESNVVQLKSANSLPDLPEPIPTLAPNGPCENTGFQAGNTSGWTGSYGTSTFNMDTPEKTCSGIFDSYDSSSDECCGLFSCSAWTPADGYVQIAQNNYNQNVGFNSAPNNTAANAATPGVHTVMTGGFDPIIPGNVLTVTPPNGANSIRLGRGSTTLSGYFAQTLRQTFLVTDANKNFIYHFAAVLNDPGSGHLDYELPFLKIRMYDANNNPISCASLDVSTANAASNAGFVSVTGTDGQPLFWKNWTSITVPLNPYMGQNVTIEFITSHCAQTGHYGYAYISAECNPQEILASSPSICGGQSITLTAPPGLNTYTWSGPGILSGQGTPTVVVNQPGSYNVTMTTQTTAPFVPCTFSIDTIILGNPDFPTAQFTPNPASVCAGSPIIFNNTSFVTGISVIDSVQWDFNSDGIIDNTTFSPTYTYSSTGNYTVTLTVFSGGCIDEATENVTITAGSTASFTTTPVCQGVATVFTNNSSGGANTYAWDFDNNGTTDNSTLNPTFTFAISGIYPVTLNVSNSGACGHDTTINVVVNPNPIANFTGTNECLTNATTFTDASTVSSGSITSWAWDFDNNTTTDNTTQNPTNTYATAGTHTINLTVTTDSSCTASFSTTVEVYDNPVANFSTDVACENFVTTFTDLSIQGDTAITSWQWDFDNNTTIDNLTQNPTNTYTSDGTFPVNLIITDGHGCKDTTNLNVIVAPKPTAAFTFTNVCFQSSTDFISTSNGNGGTLNQYAWDFTNNGSVDATTPITSNGYSSAGSYTTELVVTTTDGCKDTATMLVAVDPIPVVNFSGTNECLGNTTTFIDSSSITTGSVVSWAWDFGDGLGTSVAQSPTYTYTSSGTFNVTLTATSDSGCFINFNRNIQVYANPISNFSTDTACNTYATSFTDLTAIGNFGIQTWNWDYDNNGSADANEQNPSFIFSGAGTYPVNLAVTDTFGCVHDTTLDVTVSENPIAAFTYSNVCFGTATTITNLSSDNGGTTNIDTWEWDYEGNGSIDIAQQNPTNTFSSAGTYQTTLYVTSVLGCKDTATVEVVVDPIPVANFTATSECFEYITMFTNTSTITTGTIAQNDWDFDDGSPVDNNIDPTHIYGNSGTFNVELTVTSDSGCTHSVIVPVIVYPKPTANFDTTDVCLNIAAQFTDQSLDNGGTINGWTWDFENDGVVDNSTTQSPSHYYPAAGTYTIELIASTTDGCKDTINKTVTIHPMPVADFTYVDACFNQDIVFTNTSTVSTGTVDILDWQFGDTQTSALVDPLHNYASEGVYNVQLIVTTNNNCSDTIVKNGIEVWPLPDVNFGPTSVCLNDATQFTDSSTVSQLYTVNNNVAYSWDFADGIGTSNALDPIYMYTTDGVFMATLTVTTDHNCVNDTTIPVTVHPLPEVDFTSNTEGCSPVYVTFTNDTEIQNTDGSFIDEWDWDFNGDGITDSEIEAPMNNFINPSHSSVRDFDIRLMATSNFGCKDTLIKAEYIHSYPIPLASFTYWPNDEASIVDNEITFTDQSIIGAVWSWNLGDGTLTNVQHPVHEYTDTGYYLVELKIENIYGCIDSTQKYVNIKPIYAIWIPNAFTPNGDFTNDFFYINGYGIKELQVMIFNRWGEKIYDDIGVEQIWDGFYKGNLVQTDVYVYKVRAKDVFDEWHDYIGKVSVIR